MNIEKIKLVRDRVAALPDEKLYMGYVIVPSSFVFNRPDEGPPCGTVCCAIGALILGEQTLEKQDELAAEFGVRISRDEYSGLSLKPLGDFSGACFSVKDSLGKYFECEYEQVEYDGSNEEILLKDIFSFTDYGASAYEGDSASQKEVLLKRLDYLIANGPKATYEAMFKQREL